MPMFDFDKVWNRRDDPGDIKYSPVEGVEDAVPLWVADMDFKAPAEVTEALVKASERGIFGYTATDEEYDNLVVAWQEKRHGWAVNPEHILKTPGVVFAISAAIRAFTSEGDSVLVCQPVYPPFTGITLANSRRLVVSELKADENGVYSVDLEDFERKIADNNVKLFIFCSPHNPVGRVWTWKELSAISRICLEHNVIIVSDEIHSDFIYPGNEHIPMATISEEVADICVTCTAPSKTFNLAGLQISNIIVENDDLRNKMKRSLGKTGYSCLNTLSIAAARAAYKYGDKWLDALIAYLDENKAMTESFFAMTDKIVLTPAEGTYLLWLDCRNFGISDKSLEELFLREAGVRLQGGAEFGAGGSGFMRMNIACPGSVLRRALTRINKIL
ncbi:MAG: pyridoxal phosphate-dependent aminotransferase [Abditibacteriota bacterium]|nr:pyridoxal phosphate-dependent aminotransferase [Abditibacteriota bacterium]